MLPNSEGVGEVGMDRLVRRSLRKNPDRVIVGEVLGPGLAREPPQPGVRCVAVP